MIRSFRSKPLKQLWEKGEAKGITKELHARVRRRLDALAAAKRPEDMNVPGFNFHPLRGPKPQRYTVHVNGPWCITFEWDGVDAVRVDLEQFH